ncbi:MAG TPA: glycoside hydrolase family 30 beta sandwich domain-containing protein [Acidimicrobiales bacterium]
MTSPTDAGQRLLPVAPTEAAPTTTVTVQQASRHQTWMGVGASLTDASVTLLDGDDAALAALFDPTAATGARLNLVRLPLSSTDFSTTGWTWDWNPTTRTASPPAPAQAAAAMVEEIVDLRPDLAVVATPWTAPPSMKRWWLGLPAGLDWGDLRPESQRDYGDMLVSQAQWLLDHDVPLQAMTLGNEPATNAGDMPRMGMSDDQMIALAEAVTPRLAARGVGLWAMDHNWQHRARVDDLLLGTPGGFTGAAFHCYGGGGPEDMIGLPVPPVMTECTGTTDGWANTFRWDATHLIVGPARAGATGLFMWNLALDPQHGPRSGGCQDCRGLLTIDPATGAATPTPEYYTLAHLARAADPGAVRLDTSTHDHLPVTAFENPDGTIGVVGHNDTGTTQVLRVQVPGHEPTAIEVRSGELFTYRAPPGAPLDPPLGSIARTPDGTRWYLDLTGYRHLVPDDTVAACHGGTANTVDVPAAQLAAIPETEAAACLDPQPGDVLQHPDGDRYLLDENGDGELVRHWIPDDTAATCARAAGGQTLTVARYHLATIRTGPDLSRAGCVVRGPGGDAHVVTGGATRQWIPDSATWDCEVRRGLPVHDVPAAFVSSLTDTGWRWCLDKDALLDKVLRHSDGDAHHVLPDGTRKWIPDAATLACRVHQGMPVANTRWRQYVDAFPNNSGAWDHCYEPAVLKNRILSHPDGDSHYVDGNGVRHWIPTAAVYDCLRNQGIPAETVRWREYLTATPQGPHATC